MPNPLGLLGCVPEEVTLAKAKLDAIIAAVPLFESLSKRHLKKIAGLTSTVEYDAGDTVIQEGEPGDSFFVTVSGQAKVVSGGKTLHRLIPGDHFGEISLARRAPAIRLGGRRDAVVAPSAHPSLVPEAGEG